MKDIPVAAPGLFAIVAVISPKPTEDNERKKIKIKVNIIPIIPVSGLNPKANDKIITIITCKTEINELDIR